jgi:hypothetical protein
MNIYGEKPYQHNLFQLLLITAYSFCQLRTLQDGQGFLLSTLRVNVLLAMLLLFIQYRIVFLLFLSSFPANNPAAVLSINFKNYD